MNQPAITAPQQQPLCPEHPDRVATQTCGRCGRFLCPECRLDSGNCAACQKQLAAGVPGSAGRATAAVSFLGLVGISELARSGLAMWSMQSGASDALGAMTALYAVALLVGFFGAAVAFLMWLHRVVRQLNAHGIDIGMSPGWAVGWWFVPFANLVRPYHCVRQIITALGGERVVQGTIVSTWWGLWIAGNILDRVAARQDAALAMEVIAGLVSAGGAFLCVQIVRAVQAELNRQRAV